MYKFPGSSTGLTCSTSTGEWTFTLYTNNIFGTTNLSEANPSAPTIILIHGWQQTGNVTWMTLLKNTYLSRFSIINVIILDWSKDANMLYEFAASAVPKIGYQLANCIYELKNTNTIEINTLKLVGFSLGAHIAGYADIVGIEAAGLYFESNPIDQRLDESDADMVQGIHTTVWPTGMASRYGKVDVYFNTFSRGCGIKQPGCPANPAFCDHIRAVAYFIESILSNRFLAVPCTCGQFNANQCGESNIIVGEDLPLTAASGAYYLSTTGQSPFALGTAGLHPTF
ncbi:hypothetical protein RI129_012910 [Pyrocoelia pectoralis]|uniref:Lipase domain-containing protein n=1 Tax=Pyrocoelia pectoralis TaxID=417401 RepID=A0AAN7Z6Y9_9COLE